MTYKWLLPVCSALLFVSCQKEAADNNTFAHLFSLKKIVEAEEGDPLVVALKLDRVLDNDLQLAVELSDQVRFPMNKNDIATDFDFSYDGGKRWYRSLSPKRLIIPSGQDEVLLRYETYDDLDPELWSEQRKLRLIKSHESSGITLLSDSIEIQLSITDNESVFRSGPGSMRLQRSGAGFKIVSLSSAKITPAFKPIVDGGYLRLVGRTGVPINTFFGHQQQAKNLVFYEKTNWVGALRSAPEHQSKNWTIAINPLHENMIDKSSLLLYNDAKMAYVSPIWLRICCAFLKQARPNFTHRTIQKNGWLSFIKHFMILTVNVRLLSRSLFLFLLKKDFMRTSQKRLLSTSFIAVSFRPCLRAAVRRFKNFIMSL